MADKKLIHIVGTRCKPEVDAKFNKWYEEVHIPLLLKFKGIKKVTRGKITNPAPELPTYLAIYEYENRKAFEDHQKSPEIATVVDDVKKTWKEGDQEIVSWAQYEVLKTWGK